MERGPVDAKLPGATLPKAQFERARDRAAAADDMEQAVRSLDIEAIRDATARVRAEGATVARSLAAAAEEFLNGAILQLPATSCDVPAAEGAV